MAKVNPTLNPDSAQAGLTLESERVERLPVAHNAANLPQILPGVGPGPAMGEGDRPLEERGEPLLHVGR